MGGKRILDPFEPGIELEERQDRMRGYVLKLERTYGGQSWLEDLTVTSLSAFDETSGILTLFALTGRQPKNFDPYRECGQARTININEIIKVKRNKLGGHTMATATKTKAKATKTKAAPKTKVGKTHAAHQPGLEISATITKRLTAMKPGPQKRAEALKLYEAGATYKQIAEAVGSKSGYFNSVKKAKEEAAAAK